MPGLLQTSAIMALHSSLSSVLLIDSILDDFFFDTKLLRLSVNLVRCLPLLFTPSIFPHNRCFSNPSFLQMCPKNFSCRFLITFRRDLLHPAIFITSLLDFFSVQDIFIILLIYHISTASSFLSVSLVSVQHSHPYNSMDHTYAFSALILVSCPKFLSVKMGYILLKVSLDIAILFLISASHLASGVIVKPRYLKFHLLDLLTFV